MYQEVLDKIIAYDDICIFRHIKPDGDAMFSALALYQFLTDNYPDKKIKVCGNDSYDIISKNDIVSDDFIHGSLAIIIDTSTVNRIDDSRALEASYKIKIDHHPFGEDYADLNLVDTKTAAAAEFLADILLSDPFASHVFSQNTIRYLYYGIVTDTLNFKTSNTTAKTMKTAADLMAKGEIKASDTYEYLFNIDLSDFRKISRMRNELEIKEHFGFLILDHDKLSELGMNGDDAKNSIDEIGNIRDLNVWAIAVENNEHLFEVSVRSKRMYIINVFCKEFGGGGHANAAGVKDLDRNQLNQLFEKLAESSK